jgi:hypothetical protein
VARCSLARLGVFGSYDPVAEIDDALGQLAADLRASRARGESPMVERLGRWIDELLDERNTVTPEAVSGRHRRPTAAVPAPRRETGPGSDARVE